MELSLFDDISNWAIALVTTPTVIIGVLLGKAFAFWFNRSRTKSPQTAEPGPGTLEIRLRPPMPMLLLGSVTFVLFGGVTALSILFPNDTGTIWISLFFLGWALLGLLFILEFFRAHHTIYSGSIHGSGIQYRSLFGSKKRMSWMSVKKVRYRRFFRWFTLESATGDIARISVSAVGIIEFADEVLEQVDAHAIDQRALQVLIQTAGGKPPAYAD